MNKKKLVIRLIISIVFLSYFVAVVPNQVITVVKYYKLKNQVNTLDLELQALAGSLMPAKDIDVVIKNSGYTIKLATITDSIDANSVKAYTGEDVENGTSKILEYVIDTKGDVSYLLSYLSGYHISYSSIVLSGNEMVMQIYCN